MLVLDCSCLGRSFLSGTLEKAFNRKDRKVGAKEGFLTRRWLHVPTARARARRGRSTTKYTKGCTKEVPAPGGWRIWEGEVVDREADFSSTSLRAGSPAPVKLGVRMTKVVWAPKSLPTCVRRRNDKICWGHEDPAELRSAGRPRAAVPARVAAAPRESATVRTDSAVVPMQV
jgi:hypothetical protein